jgi:hypothetical protein
VQFGNGEWRLSLEVVPPIDGAQTNKAILFV